MTMDINTRMLENTGRVDVRKTVRKIRSQRAFSIQMPDQYVFCYTALIEHAQQQGLLPDVDLYSFSDSSSEESEWRHFLGSILLISIGVDSRFVH